MVRHSPVLFNLAWHDAYFWDGGAPDLESQLLGPLFSRHEMDANFDSILSYVKTTRESAHSFKLLNGVREIESLDVLKVMAPGGIIFFSTNHQRFEPRLDTLNVKGLKELTPKTIPEDYRNQGAHRCWSMTK